MFLLVLCSTSLLQLGSVRSITTHPSVQLLNYVSSQLTLVYVFFRNPQLSTMWTYVCEVYSGMYLQRKGREEWWLIDWCVDFVYNQRNSGLFVLNWARVRRRVSFSDASDVVDAAYISLFIFLSMFSSKYLNSFAMSNTLVEDTSLLLNTLLCI